MPLFSLPQQEMLQTECLGPACGDVNHVNRGIHILCRPAQAPVTERAAGDDRIRTGGLCILDSVDSGVKGKLGQFKRISAAAL